MTAAYGDQATSRSARLERILRELVGQVPEVEAAALVSFDGLAMASELPKDFDEDRVAAMSAALLSLGERAAEGLGRGQLAQVYVEGDDGTVFLIAAEDAVLVAVTAKGAKVGMMLFEIRRAAAAMADALRAEQPEPDVGPQIADLAAAAPLQVVARPTHDPANAHPWS